MRLKIIYVSISLFFFLWVLKKIRNDDHFSTLTKRNLEEKKEVAAGHDVPHQISSDGGDNFLKSESSKNSSPTKVLAPDGAGNDFFGYSVSASANLVAVGAYGNDNNGNHGSGSAYLYSIDGTFINKIVAPDLAWFDEFGRSVSASSNIVVVGASRDDAKGVDSGSAYLYTTNGNFTRKIVAPDGSSSDLFGWSVSASDNIIVVGAYADDDHGSKSGSAYLYSTNGNFTGKIVAPDGSAGDEFGRSVSASSNIVVVGAHLNDNNGTDSGAAYLYSTNGTFIKKIVAPDGADDDWFGYSVSASNDIVVVGAYGNNDNGAASGSAYLYSTNGNFIKKMVAPDAAAGDWFGKSVSASGNVVVIGAHGNDDKGDRSGSTYLYSTGGDFISKVVAPDESSLDFFGHSVSASDSVIVVGAPQNDDKGHDSGSAYIYSNSPTTSTTSTPTTAPTGSPTTSPTSAPTVAPTKAPTESPTASPTSTPTSAPTTSPTPSPTSSPTKVLDGFNITSSSTSSNNLVFISRTFGIHTDDTKTELLDAECNNSVTSLLYKNDTNITSNNQIVVQSRITVEPEEINISGDQGVLFFQNGTLATSPSAISGLIRFCLKSTSFETFGSISVGIKSFKRIYTIAYSGEDTTFQVDTTNLTITENVPTNNPAFGNVLTNFTIDAIRCSATSTDAQGQDPIAEGDTFYVCIKPSTSDGVLEDINLLAFYDFDTVDEEFDSNFTLVSTDAPTLSVVQIGSDGDWTRIAVPILALFTQGSSDKLSLQGNADVAFNQTSASKTARKTTTERIGFELNVQLILKKEYGCFSKLFRMIESKFF